jgi:diguanylate cyclase (GGDEF)-like protein
VTGRTSRVPDWLRAPVLAMRPGPAIALVVLVSVVMSVAALVLTTWLVQGGFSPTFGRYLVIAVASPLMVATPVAWVIVTLLHEAEAARAEAQRLAWHDELTGLLARRRFLELAQREVDLARRNGQPVAVGLLDLDDFKKVNDTHGHEAGDQVLRAVAQACRATLRSTDLIGRWGGEEFVLLLPATGAEGAAEVLERVRAAIAARATVHRGTPIACTASIGAVLVAPDTPRWLDDLMQEADVAMYRAKQAGKNRVVVDAPAG